MKIDELKQTNPEVFKEIFQAGIRSERNRVSAWLNTSGNDLKTLSMGISYELHPKAANEELATFNAEVDKALSQ